MAFKELLAKIETKKMRIGCSVNQLETSSLESDFSSRKTRISQWLQEFNDYYDQLISKSPSEEKERLCLEAETFTNDIEGRMSLLKLDNSSSKAPQLSNTLPLKMQLECPKFSGSIREDDKFEFRSFLSKFEFCTANVNRADKLLLLKTKLEGRAFEMISHLKIEADNYEIAIASLKEEYLNSSLIKTQIFREILPVPERINKLKDLKHFLGRVKADLSELDASFGTDFTKEGSTSGSLIAHVLINKFPNIIKREILSKGDDKSPSYNFIMSKVFDIIDIMMETPLDYSRREKGPPISSSPLEFKSNMASPPPESRSYKFCKFCDSKRHKSKDCDRFPAYDDKLRRAKQLNLCPNCLGNHTLKGCKGVSGFPFPCLNCGSKTHFSVMCPKQTKQFVGKNILTCQGGCIFPVFKLSLKANGRPVYFFALLDSGSQKSFFSQEVVDQLCDDQDLKTKNVQMSVNTLTGHDKLELQECNVSIKLGYQQPFNFNVLFSKELDLKFQVDNFDTITSNIRSEGFRLCPGYESLNGSHILGIIGLDILQRIDNLHTVPCIKGSAWKIGKFIVPFGDNQNFLKEESNNKLPPFDRIVSHLDSTESYLVESGLNPVLTYEDGLASVFEDSLVERGVEKLLSLESIGIDESKDISSDDEEKIEEFKEAVSLEGGKYYINLPWKLEKLPLVKSNFKVSFKILERVADSLEKEGKYHDYLLVFKEYEREGIVEKFSVPSGTHESFIWIPHRPVYKEGPGVTTKIRPVFNCSLKCKGGTSLNDAAYSGVNLTANLLRLLVSFRANKHVLLGDIKKAFLQIRLKTTVDKNRFCFLLKEGNKLCTYRFNTILFGFNASPFILNFLLKYHAEKYDEDLASFAMSNKFYVDNLVTTSNDQDILLSVYSLVRSRLLEAGLELQSCNSNYLKLKNKMLSDGTLASPAPTKEKVLGYQYNTLNDSLKIIPTIVDIKVKTKRGILSQVSSVFDPLSLLLPVTVQGRIIISLLWKKKFLWDQQIPADLLSLWHMHAKELNNLGEYEFPRCVLRENFPTEFICFCDASKQAYGFVLYAKQGTACNLLFAKAKVAPIKGKSLPTLELLAIYLALKVIPQILTAFKGLNVLNLYIVSDAQVALSWVLNGKGSKKNIFVENRVSDIKRYSENIQLNYGCSPRFKYVQSAENPADLLTRGINTSKFTQSFNFWIHGPEWVNQCDIDWPNFPLPCLTDINKKKISCLYSSSADPTADEFPLNISRFSTLSKTIRVLEKVLDFCDKLRGRKVDNFNKAKLLLFAHMQHEVFFNELRYLQQPTEKVPPPRVSALGLFLDKDGLIRTRGRIQYAEALPFEAKFPLLMGKGHHLTKLVIQEAHYNSCHLGTNSTLSKLRLSGFWVPQGRQAVKKIINACVTCKRINALPFKAPAGSILPAHRVNLVRPFQQVGVDFTGHFLVNLNNVEVKMYILIFTCMSLRAIHMELIPDMSCRSFILAFVRFSNLYGVPSHLYSDNAKSFVAAGILLSDILASDDFKERFRSSSVDHRTIPLYSAWQGGVWERMIRTVKQCLKKLLGRRKVEYFEFSTAISDVTKAVNDRPLTYIASSDTGLNCLTPNHFLQSGYNSCLLLNNYMSEDLCPDPPNRVKLLHSLELREKLVDRFKRIWQDEYLLSLRETNANIQDYTAPKVAVGEIILIRSPNKPRQFWRLGKVLRLIVGKDDQVRSAIILRDGCEQVHSLKNLFPLEIRGDSESASAEFCEEGGPFFCPSCSIANDGTSPMVCCDACDRWYHFGCAGVSQQDTTGDWICSSCVNSTHH